MAFAASTVAGELMAACEALATAEAAGGLGAVGGATEALMGALEIEAGSIGSGVLAHAEVSGGILAGELGGAEVAAVPSGTEMMATEKFAVDGTGNMLTRGDVDSRGIPTSVEQVNGRYPINSFYAGLEVPLDWFEGISEGLRNGTIEFTEDGFPDFNPWVKDLGDGTPADVQIDLTGERFKDEQLANQACGLEQTPEGCTWHHHQDTGRMQLVNSDVHAAVRHTGGFSIHTARGS